MVVVTITILVGGFVKRTWGSSMERLANHPVNPNEFPVSVTSFPSANCNHYTVVPAIILQA